VLDLPEREIDQRVVSDSLDVLSSGLAEETVAVGCVVAVRAISDTERCDQLIAERPQIVR